MTATAIDYSRTAAKRTPLTMAFWVGVYIAMIPFVNWSFTWAPNWQLYGDFKFNPVTIVTGLVLVVRDFAQRQVGHSIFFAMLVALLLTVLLAGPNIAVASGTAFFISETVDWALFSFTRASLPTRVLLSAAVAIPIDSVAFLLLADTMHASHTAQFTPANVIMSVFGKMIGLAVVMLLLRRRQRLGAATPVPST